MNKAGLFKRQSVLSQALQLLKKDVLIERRTGEIVISGGFFGALLGVMASAAFYAGPSQAHYLAPGAIWLSTAFTAIFAFTRSWQREREEGALDVLLASRVSRAAIFLSKTMSIFLFLLMIELVVVPCVSLLLHLNLANVGAGLSVILLLATLGLAGCGSLFGAMTVRSKARELMFSIVIFSLLTPTLVIGVSATRQLADGASFGELSDYIVLLSIFDVIFVGGGTALFRFVVD